MEKELEYLFKCTQSPEHPCVGILGGAKARDKGDEGAVIGKDVTEMLQGLSDKGVIVA